MLHRLVRFFQRTRFLPSIHSGVITIVQYSRRHCEERNTAKFPAVLHYLTPWLEPLPVGSSQSVFACLAGRSLDVCLGPVRRSGSNAGEPRVKRKPQMLNLTQVSEWDQGHFRRKDDYLAAEEPLEIRIGAEPLSVTMRTPGHDLELAAGFLFTEGIIGSADQIVSLKPGVSGDDGSNSANLVRAELVPEAVHDFAKMQRHFFAASSCGICGKASIDSVRSRRLKAPNPDFRCAPQLLLGLPDALRSSQDVFQRTGGLHAAALFDSAGCLQVLREDIGRHNAVDKVFGWALLAGHLPLSDSVLLVSGRGGFEIIQKAIVAGVPVVASVSAPSGLAVQLARELRLTLIGFLRGERFVIYSGEQRIVKSKDGGQR